MLLDDEEAVAVAVGLRTAANGTVAGIAETSVRALAKLEQLDLSEQIRRSYVKAAEGIRSVWPEILAAVGDEAMAEGFVATIQAFGALPQTGYVLVTAVKDER